MTLLGLARRTAAYLPRLEDALKRCYPAALACANWRIPIFRLQGITRAGCPGTVLVAGQEPWVDYLPSRFFSTVTARELLEVTPIWLAGRSIERLGPSADLTVMRVDRISSALLFRDDYLAVPAWVKAVLPVPTNPLDLARGNHSLQGDLRLIKRGNLQAQVTREDSGFTFFYESLYVPFVRRRHAELAFVRDAYWLRRRCQKGGILWITCAGERIAGMLFEERRRVLYLWAEGVLNGDPKLVKRGAISALYFHIIDYACRQGCHSIDFGAVRPCLGDGLLRYKRKWGMTITEKRDNYYDFLVRWNEWNKSVAAFFLETPVLYRSSNGLSALTSVVADNPATEADGVRAHRSFWSDGVERLSIVSPSGWERNIRAPAHTWLLDCPSPGTAFQIRGLIGRLENLG